MSGARAAAPAGLFRDPFTVVDGGLSTAFEELGHHPDGALWTAQLVVDRPEVVVAARRWLHRDTDKVPAAARSQLSKARSANAVLDKMVVMREELRQLWLNTSHSREQLAADLQAWCRRAEDSGIAALREFSMQLRAARVQTI